MKYIFATKKNVRFKYKIEFEILSSQVEIFSGISKKLSTLSFFLNNIQKKKNVRAVYQAQIETQVRNRKFFTIMVSVTGGFRFITKNIGFTPYFYLCTSGNFKSVSDTFSKWYFCFNFLGVSKWTIFVKNDVSAGNGA